MKLYTTSIINTKTCTETTKISVMSRHTKNDGITPDERIVEGLNYHEWKKEFGPPGKLIGEYYSKGITWEEYEIGYLEFLRSGIMVAQVRAFAKRCTQELITLLCIEESAERCHRRLLAEELQKHEPSLIIEHK